MSNLVLQTGRLLEAVDPAVPDAVGDGREDDVLSFVSFDRKTEISRQISFIDSSHQTQIDDSVQKSLKIKEKGRRLQFWETGSDFVLQQSFELC